MKKKKNQKPKAIDLSELSEKALEDRKNTELSRMKLRDLQRAVVLKGMPFDKVISSSVPQLQNWWWKNYDNSESPLLLVEYDNWKENELEKRGYKKGDIMLSPCFRLSYTGNLEEIPMEKIKEPTEKKVAIPRDEKKPKRERDETTGVLSGTKKHMTYNLARNNVPVEEVVKQVIKKFPEAQEKSIKIWYKRALKPEGDD